MTAPMENIIQATERYVREQMSHNDSSHNFQHITRVLTLARHIASRDQAFRPNLPYDPDLITLASLLHDVGDREYLKPRDDPRTMIYAFLLSAGAPEALAQTVQTLCSHVSYTTERSNPVAVQCLIGEIPELAVVQDADRLDALGAVGIGRCFTYNAVKAQEGSMGSAVKHFGEKLLQLEGKMKTSTGREMARVRTERITEFMRWWGEENAGTEGQGDGLLDA